MAGEDWTTVYETHNRLEADAVRTVLEDSGFQVLERGDPVLATSSSFSRLVALAVPPEDAAAAREVLKERDTEQDPAGSEADAPLSVREAADAVVGLRRGHPVAGCKYCGIPTLDVREDELESRQIALLRAAGLGVNSASFSQFEPGERICTECAAHEVECDVCGRQLDGFLDSGIYRRVNADEAYVCTTCAGRLDDALESSRDW